MSADSIRFSSKVMVVTLLEFLRRIGPRSKTTVFERDKEVWLLKPTTKGGRTIGRVIFEYEQNERAEFAWETYISELAVTDKQRWDEWENI